MKHKLLKLSDPVTLIQGVGPALKIKLEKLGIRNIQDILFHLPYRYIDRTRLTPIGAIQVGNQVYIQGEIELTQIKYGRRRSLLCQLADGTGSVILRFFYFSKSQQQALQQGKRLRCYGQVRRGAGCLEIVHPEYRHISDENEPVLEEQLTPVYPATEGLQQNRLRQLSDQALIHMQADKTGLNELLPDDLLTNNQLPLLLDALEYVHRPPPDADVTSLIEKVHPAQQRLVFEELLAHQLSLLELRKTVRVEDAIAFPASNQFVPEFLSCLPFDLTGAQKKAHKIIEHDLQQSIAMLRLVQGDVGSGKTVVAALSALQAIEAGYQVAIMSPTELLAEQHFINFKHWFDAFDIHTCLLTGKLKKAEKENTLKTIKSQRPVLVIGTHALFQEDVQFGKLGLVIIDEQHRFGVHQRRALLEKGRTSSFYPHQLIMTATPIPRTLTMTAYADLDHTIIDELPPSRKPVTTHIISNQRREEIIERIENASKDKRQVYWVCTLIEESENLQCETAIATFETLSTRLASINVGLIHGRLKNDEKESIMRQFKAGEIDLLVATTVIEVGVDVPNANLMIIENAERLGLSQLHQLRGRIGRGDQKSDCILMYQAPLGELAKQRLETMRHSNDGFVIAEKDLELRGPGEILGTRQAGLPELKIADLMRDAKLLPNVQQCAKILENQYPENIKPIISRWLGNNVRYGNV
ncbi:MAG: ATP-dependent DNA helicase RecG [Pseudomonadota bacterium]